jgi:putative transposase
MAAVDAVGPDLGATPACRALGISRATLYRRRRPPVSTARPSRARRPRALSAAERQTVRAVLHSERFCDTAPAEVVATLLDEGIDLASERTMDRILAQAGQTGERRHQLTHPRPARPELLATRPNELWSWDIERHEAPLDRAVVKGHRLQSVAAGW